MDPSFWFCYKHPLLVEGNRTWGVGRIPFPSKASLHRRKVKTSNLETFAHVGTRKKRFLIPLLDLRRCGSIILILLQTFLMVEGKKIEGLAGYNFLQNLLYVKGKLNSWNLETLVHVGNWKEKASWYHFFLIPYVIISKITKIMLFLLLPLIPLLTSGIWSSIVPLEKLKSLNWSPFEILFNLLPIPWLCRPSCLANSLVRQIHC